MFGIDTTKLNAFKQGQLITGKGTGTSDDIKMSAPKGSYILPADTTAHLGLNGIHDFIRGLEPQEHIPRTENININVSNGEYILPPHAVNQIGTDTLDDIRQATHDFRDKNSGMNFADGGKIGGVKRRYTEKDGSPLKRHFDTGGMAGISYEEDQRRKREAELRQQNAWSGTDTAKAAALGTAAAGYGVNKALSPVLENAFGQTAGQIAKEGLGNAWGAVKNMAGKFEAPTMKGALSPAGFMKGNLAMSGIQGAFTGYDTPTEQYRDRLGLQNDNPSLLSDLGVRALGVATDVGNAATFGLLGKTFQDREMAKWNPATLPATNNTSTTNATPANKPTSWADDPEIQKMFNSGKSTIPADTQVMSEKQLDKVAGKNYKTIEFPDIKPPSPTELAIRQMQSTAQQGIKPEGYQIPTAPTRGYDDRVARENLAKQLSTVQPGARGITAAQMRGLQELSQGDDNIRQNTYNQQMNMTQAQMKEAGENARQTFAQQMAMGKAMLDNAGQNERQQAQLGYDAEKARQVLGLDQAKFQHEVDKDNIANYGANQAINIQEQYVNAKTDEERQAIMNKAQSMQALTGGGKSAVAGKDRYMTVQGGQEVDANGQVFTRPSGVFDTQSGKMVDVGGGQPINNQPKAGQVINGYKFKGGDPANQSNWEKA